MPIAHISPNRRPMHVNLDPAVLDQALHSDGLYGIQRGALSPAAVKVLMRSARTKRFNPAIALSPEDRYKSSVGRGETRVTAIRHPELSIVMGATRQAVQLAAECPAAGPRRAEVESWGNLPGDNASMIGQPRRLQSFFHEMGPSGLIAGHRDHLSHTQHVTAVFTLEGSRLYELKGHNGFQTEEVTQPGDLVLIGSGNYHAVRNAAPGYSTSCVVAHARV